MKTVLVVAAFFVLVGVLTGTRPALEGGDQVTVKFAPSWVTKKEQLKSIRVFENKTGNKVTIELQQFRPDWASRALPMVRFEADQDNCQFIATDPVLFRCSAQPVAKTKAYGVKLTLEHLESTHFKGQKISEDGGVESTDLYAVDIGLRMGKKLYRFRAFADPKSVESLSKNTSVPVATVK